MVYIFLSFEVDGVRYGPELNEADNAQRALGKGLNFRTSICGLGMRKMRPLPSGAVHQNKSRWR
jgi:hypothetical protein